MTKMGEWWEWVLKWLSCKVCGHKFVPDECYTIGSNVNQICRHCGKVKFAKGVNV